MPTAYVPVFDLGHFIAVFSIVLSMWHRLPRIGDLDTLIAPGHKTFSEPELIFFNILQKVTQVCEEPCIVRNLA